MHQALVQNVNYSSPPLYSDLLFALLSHVNIHAISTMVLNNLIFFSVQVVDDILSNNFLTQEK